MGDRTNVTLYLLGSIKQQDLNALITKIEAIEGKDDFGNPNLGMFGWHDRYTALEDETHDAIAAAGLKYAVQWDGKTGAFDTGIEIYEDDSVSEWSCAMDEPLIFLSIYQAKDEDQLHKAGRHQSIINTGLMIQKEEANA